MNGSLLNLIKSYGEFALTKLANANPFDFSGVKINGLNMMEIANLGDLNAHLFNIQQEYFGTIRTPTDLEINKFSTLVFVKKHPLLFPDYKSPEPDSEDDEEKVHTVQSSALIGDHENAELMKIRQKMDMDLLTMGLEIVEKNRHYLWIVVTFCIMMFGYMLTKNRTVDGAI
jgi:hypothetical protein